MDTLRHLYRPAIEYTLPTCNGGKEYVNFRRVTDTRHAHHGRYLATRRNRAHVFGIFERAAPRDLKNFSKVSNRSLRVIFWSLCRDELGLNPKLYLGHLITELTRDHLEYPFRIECRVIGYFLVALEKSTQECRSLRTGRFRS